MKQPGGLIFPSQGGPQFALEAVPEKKKFSVSG
jgi:hypothetical protein